MRKLFRNLYAALTTLLLSLYSDLAFATETETIAQSEDLGRLASKDDIITVIIVAALIIVGIGIFNTIKIVLKHKDKE